MDKKIISDVVEMTKGISWRDILTPLNEEEIDLAPLPEIEYKIVEWNTMDKLIRDVNAHLKNGRQTEWGVQVVNWQTTRFYQSMIRWVAKTEETTFWMTNKFLENEPDLLTITSHFFEKCGKVKLCINEMILSFLLAL